MHGRAAGILIAVVVALLAGCAADGVRPSGGELDITMRDYAFAPDAWVVEVGEATTVVLTNVDDVGHDLSVGRSIIEEEDGDPVGYTEDLLAEIDARIVPASAEHRAERADNVIVTVAPGETVEVIIRPSAEHVGQWEVGCFSGGGCHYEAGLQATLTIEE